MLSSIPTVESLRRVQNLCIMSDEGSVLFDGAINIEKLDQFANMIPKFMDRVVRVDKPWSDGVTDMERFTSPVEVTVTNRSSELKTRGLDITNIISLLKAHLLRLGLSVYPDSFEYHPEKCELTWKLGKFL